MRRGEIWWADFGPPRDSGPAKLRPAVIVQADGFNASRIKTVMVALISSNLRLAEAPGNVRLSKRLSGLPKPSVVNVSQVATVDKATLTSHVSSLGADTMREVDRGLRLALDL